MRPFTRNTSIRIACAAVVMLLAGCSTLESWNPFASKKTKNAPAELSPVASSFKVRTLWEASVGNAEKSIFSPAALDASVVVAAANGTLARIDASSGKTLWRVNAGMPLTAGAAADGDTIAVVGEKGMVLAFDREGKQRWKVQTSSEVLSAPAVGAGLVIVRSVDSRISAYDAATGARKWAVQRTVPALILRNAPGILIADKSAYVALPGGRLISVSLASGVVLWEGVVSDPKGATELERIADTSGAPMLIGRDICVVAFQGKVACFDAQNGAPRWSKEASSEVGVGMDERFVFTADDKGKVTAFTRDSGISVWRNPSLSFRRLSTPFSWDRAVAVGDFEGFVHLLSREDGSFIARVRVGKGGILSAPALVGSTLIYQTLNGDVAALSAE